MFLMRNDIKSRADIELLINNFYEKVKTDPVIGYIFTDVVKVDWGKHLPVMYSFWENTLFYTGTYSGNPMIIHQRIHQIVHLNAQHFDQWTALFSSTVDNLFEGEKAELAKQRANSIVTVMKIKILNRN
jgi:hemoglobin